MERIYCLKSIDRQMKRKIPESKGRFHRAKTHLMKGWILIILIMASGCAAYHPMPITADAVRARLQPPDMAQVRILARKIKHPILHPIELKAGEGLSPDGAAVLAVLLNPSLRTVRDQRALSEAQLLDAGLLPNPELTYSLDVPTGGDTSGRVNAFGLGLNWNVTSLISRASQVREAKARGEAVDLDIAWKEWQVAQAAKNAVYQLASLKKQLSLAEKDSRYTAENLKHVQEAVAAGTMTSSALIAAQSASRLTDEKLLDLKKQADRQLLQLRRLMGLPSNSPIRLSKDIHLPPRVELPAAKALIEGLAQRRLDLLALRRGYDSQEAAVRAAIMDQFPKIGIGPTIGRDTDNVRTTGFGLNIVLPIFNRNQGKIAEERATRQKLFDEYVNRIFEARSDIELIISGIHFTNEQIAAALKNQAALGNLVENYRAALSEGRIDTPVYNAVWNDYLRAQMRASALKGKLAQAVVALQLASGFYEIPKPDRLPAAAPMMPKKESTP
jgi:cobalt-zinc-cadmium efflux system outer membrane protein